MKQKITIGRNPDNDIVVDGSFDTVSGHHATISQTDTGYIFEDHSTNGSYINEQQVHNKTVIIKHGDNIRLSTAYSLTWRQIDALLATDRATQLRDNRATQLRPQTESVGSKIQSADYGESDYSSGSNSRNAVKASDYKEPVPQIMKEPECINKFNWGALVMPGLWGLFNNYWWLFFLQFIPYLGVFILLVLRFVFAFCGNEWAWKKDKDSISADEFDKKQHRWNVAAGVFAIIIVLICIIAAIAS